MLKGIDVNQVIEFSTSKDKEPKTVFLIKPLSGLDMLEATQKLEGKMSLSVSYIEVLLDKAIVGIKNPDLSEKAEVVSFINSLDSLTIMEVVGEIVKTNSVTDDEAKN